MSVISISSGGRRSTDSESYASSSVSSSHSILLTDGDSEDGSSSSDFLISPPPHSDQHPSFELALMTKTAAMASGVGGKTNTAKRAPPAFCFICGSRANCCHYDVPSCNRESTK